VSFRQLVEDDSKMMKYLTRARLEDCFDPAPYIRHAKDLFNRAGL
jgi:adenylosuccinate lyase